MSCTAPADGTPLLQDCGCLSGDCATPFDWAGAVVTLEFGFFPDWIGGESAYYRTMLIEVDVTDERSHSWHYDATYDNQKNGVVIQTDEDTTNWPPPPAAFPEGVATVLSVSGTTLVARAYENVLEEDMTWNLHTWIFTYTLSDDFASDVASWGSTMRNFIDAYDGFPTDQVCGRIWADTYVLDPTTGTIGDGSVSEPYFFPAWFWPRAVFHYWSNYFNHLKLTGNFAVDDTFTPNWGAPTAFMIDYWHFSTARILVEDGICLRDVSFDGSSFTVHSCTTCNNDETNWSTGLVVECPPGLVPRVNRWIEITFRDNWLNTAVGDACCVFT